MRSATKSAARSNPVATILNLNSHPTVLGSSNHKATGDWPQFANNLMMDDAGTFGPRAMTVVGTLGRQQPARGDCPDKTLAAKGDSDPQSAICKLTEYAQRVVDRAQLRGCAQLEAVSETTTRFRS